MVQALTMGQRRGPACTICRHSERWRIELLRAGGASGDAIAKKFGVSPHALHRHWHNHVTADAKASYLAGPADMAKLHERAAAEGESVLDYLRIVRTSLMSALAACSEAGDARGVAIVSGQLIAVLDKLGKITGEISQLAGSVTNINVAVLQSPEFARAQATILRALAPHAAARADVVAALRELDADPVPVPVARPLVDVTPRLPLLPPRSAVPT
jgi:hypothetical protein